MLLASASLLGSGGLLWAGSPVVEVSSEPIPAERAGNDVELLPPANSTLEIRMARRPWLIERLMKPSPSPSIKMNPPQPPSMVPVDPPSTDRIVPNSDAADQWARRDSITGLPEGAESPASVAPRREVGRSLGPHVTGPIYADLNESSSNSVDRPSAPLSDEDAESFEPGEHSSLSQTPNPSFAEEQTETGQQPEAWNEQSLREDPIPLRDPVPMQDPSSALATDGESDEGETSAESAPAAEVESNDDRETSQPGASPKAYGSKSEAESEAEVTVRRLRINRDGTPVAQLPEMTPVDESPEAEAESSNAAADSSNSVRVGDLPEEVEGADDAGAGRSSDDDQGEDDETAEPQPTVVDLDYTGRPRQAIRLTRSVYRMQNMMKQCLRYYYSRPENANERSNWGMLHAIMVYGADTKIIAGRRTYSAIAWIAGNNSCRGKKLLELQDGVLTANSGIGLQGHQAQMLAILALADVPIDYPLYAGDRRFSVRDLVEQEMLACHRGEELTFTLIGLAHYLDTETVWTNDEGESWDFQKLIREELAQPIVGAACGGTHRLMGYAHALRKRRAEGRPIDGQWKRAEVYGDDFVRYVYRLQNRDGSMSTDWFEGREDNGDLDRKIQTTGHMVEWLLTITPDSQLQDSRLVRAVQFLLSSMYQERDHDWKVGPKGHALRSLAMYYERVYQQGPAWRSPGMATGQTRQRR